MKKKLLAMSLTAAVAVSGCSQPGSDAVLDLDVREQRDSYAVGVDLARNLQSQDLPVEVDALLAGLRDQFADAAELSDEDLAAALEDFRALIADAAEGKATENRVAGEEFLAANGARAEVTTTASGLQYEVIEPSDGATPTETDTVTVHYRGTTLDGTVFDASLEHEPPAPATFPLNRVIAGWTEGLQLMSVGSKFKFYIPSELAYANSPPPGAAFGPGSTLVFEVELLEIAAPQ